MLVLMMAKSMANVAWSMTTFKTKTSG